MIEYHVGGLDRTYEILGLLARCFPEYWGGHAERGHFPHFEIPILAEIDGQLAGHLGIMPFQIHLSRDEVIEIAGVASVAVAPEFRRRGISSELCRMALEYGADQGWPVMPLFTSLFRVYEKVGWKLYDRDARPLVFEARSPGPGNLPPERGRRAARLTQWERDFIREVYHQGLCFPGKVVRDADHLFHSWRRIFDNDDYIFYIDKEGYALQVEGALAELYTLPDSSGDALLDTVARANGGIVTAWLPPSHPLRHRRRLEAPPYDVMHGEKPMLADCCAANPLKPLLSKGRLNFPVIDKF